MNETGKDRILKFSKGRKMIAEASRQEKYYGHIKGILEVDVTKPLAPQLKAAKKILDDAKDRYRRYKKWREQRGNGNVSLPKVRNSFKPRQDRSEWIILVRVLDAINAGIKWKQIATILNPNQQSTDIYAAEKWVNDKHDQAMRFVQEDYRLILFLKFPRRNNAS